MEVHLAKKSSVISHQTVYLQLQLAKSTIYTVEFRIVTAWNHSIIMVIPFLYTLKPSINWNIHTITC